MGQMVFQFINDAKYMPGTAAPVMDGATGSLSASTESLQGPLTIVARFVYSIYRTPDESYCVNIYSDKETEKKYTCVGSQLPMDPGLFYKLTLEPTENPKYGKQYKVCYFNIAKGRTEEEVVSYLSSRLFKGVGRSLAKSMFKAYGTNIYYVIEEHPDRLLGIKGMSPKKQKAFVESYRENNIPDRLRQLLAPAELPLAKVNKIYQFYKKDAYDRIRENPYVICRIHGVSFKSADALKTACGIADLELARVDAAAKEVLKKNQLDGSVGMELKPFLEETTRLLSVKSDDVWTCVKRLFEIGELSYRKPEGLDVTYVYSPETKKMEEELADLVFSHTKTGENEGKKAEKYLDGLAGLTLDASQEQAVLNAYRHGLSIITGGPGTGKTTIVKAICDIWEGLHPDMKDMIHLMAPTGKAARRLSDSTDRPARTIHSTLELAVHDGDYEYDGNSIEIEKGLVIVDEFSMVDMCLAHKLFSCVKDGVRMVMVGDKDQLPSVGSGNVLGDIIASGAVPVSELKYVHRVSGASGITENAHGMQDGWTELKEFPDFKVIYTDQERTISNFEVLLEKAAPVVVNEYMDARNAGEEVMCLLPFRKHPCGVQDINNRLQLRINPPSGLAECAAPLGVTFREGDPVMHVSRNHAEDRVFNGSEGRIRGIETDDKGFKTIYVDYGYDDDGEIEYEYDKSNIEQLSLNYCNTIHKSQGSEYDTVVVCLTRSHKIMLRRNLLYTAITRARKRVVVVASDKECIKTAIENCAQEDRKTLLAYLLKEKLNCAS